VTARPADRGDEPSSSFRRPASLTLAGRRAFDGAVQDYARQLGQQLIREAQQRHRRPDTVYTFEDVRAAQVAYEQRIRERPDDHVVDVRRLAILLLLVAAPVGVLACYPSGFAQAVLLGLFVAMETAAVLLIWRSRPRPHRDE
jgi:hypothetical protein